MEHCHPCALFTPMHMYVLVRSVEKQTDFRVHMCIIWFLSHENFPLCVPPPWWRESEERHFIHLFFLLLGVPICSSKVIIVLKIPGCEKYFWLRYKGKEWSRTLNEMSAAFKKKKKKIHCETHCPCSIFFFFQNQRSPPGAIPSSTYCRNIPAASTSSKSGMQRTQLALIFSLDFTPLHQDKLMKVKNPTPTPTPTPSSSPAFPERCRFIHLPLTIWWG